MNDMAGGAAYERFSQAILWLKRHDKPEKQTLLTPVGLRDVTFNRSVQIRKARNGAGAGAELAFDFEGGSLRFAEQGIVMPEDVHVAKGVSEEVF